MDFFLRTADALVLVEVKAGSARAKSLSTMIKSDHCPDITWGIKLKKSSPPTAAGAGGGATICSHQSATG